MKTCFCHSEKNYPSEDSEDIFASKGTVRPDPTLGKAGTLSTRKCLWMVLGYVIRSQEAIFQFIYIQLGSSLVASYYPSKLVTT